MAVRWALVWGLTLARVARQCSAFCASARASPEFQ